MFSCTPHLPRPARRVLAGLAEGLTFNSARFPNRGRIVVLAVLTFLALC